MATLALILVGGRRRWAQEGLFDMPSSISQVCTGLTASDEASSAHGETSGVIERNKSRVCWAKGRQDAASSDKAHIPIGRTSRASIRAVSSPSACDWAQSSLCHRRRSPAPTVNITRSRAPLVIQLSSNHGSLAATAFIVLDRRSSFR
jgi:hypothetical protein